jgi:murein L,D-transpeptidase YcbB/YkuD
MKIQLPLVIIILICFSCHVSSQKTVNLTQSRDTSISVNNSYSELFFDSLQLENFIARENIKDTLAAAMRNFYNQRNYEYAWFFKEGLADYASTFMGQQDEYMNYSRDSSIYNPVLETTLDSLSDSILFNPPDSVRLRTELLLTSQFFRYASKAYVGRRDINTKDLGWYIPRTKINPIVLLDSLLQNQGKNFSQYEPLNRQYNLLKNYLLKYYEADKEGLWQPIAADKKSYKRGDSSLTIAQIKKRLLLTGDLVLNDTSSVFTDSLATAIKRYQHRYGLAEDGAVGPAVLKEMNRPISDRIRQILINMERIRWVPAEPASGYLLVNIPEFRLHVYEKGTYKWDMRVVVGSTAHNTVIFTGNLKYVVFSPYWNVPPSIIRKEIVPGMKRNKNYLASHNMEWNGGAVRQKPGPRNSLGLVKFLFPNSYNIYLHDTPSKSLFNESKRAFSHGCIRLSEPKKLAEYLLRNDPAWNEQSITKAMNGGKEKYVTLKENVPVFIGYFTAWVDRDGKLNFRDDIYGHDKEMGEHLFSSSKK